MRFKQKTCKVPKLREAFLAGKARRVSSLDINLSSCSNTTRQGNTRGLSTRTPQKKSLPAGLALNFASFVKGNKLQQPFPPKNCNLTGGYPVKFHFLWHFLRDGGCFNSEFPQISSSSAKRRSSTTSGSKSIFWLAIRALRSFA